MTPRSRMPARRSQTGTTLVEVLVTVVLVSVGLLGIVGLQLTNVQNTNSAAQRFDATELAQDVLERMRGNRPGAIAGEYDIGLGANPAGGTVAGDDLVAWKDLLANLPDGDGAVDVDANNIATIQIRWTDASNQNADAERTMDLFVRSQL